jgi:hypothetical protein
VDIAYSESDAGRPIFIRRPAGRAIVFRFERRSGRSTLRPLNFLKPEGLDVCPLSEKIVAARGLVS